MIKNVTRRQFLHNLAAAGAIAGWPNWMPRPDHTSVTEANRTIDLDGFFGFHPALRPLLESWQAGHLASYNTGNNSLIRAIGLGGWDTQTFPKKMLENKILRPLHDLSPHGC